VWSKDARFVEKPPVMGRLKTLPQELAKILETGLAEERNATCSFRYLLMPDGDDENRKPLHNDET
jgi:hypothetical protein